MRIRIIAAFIIVLMLALCGCEGLTSSPAQSSMPESVPSEPSLPQEPSEPSLPQESSEPSETSEPAGEPADFSRMAQDIIKVADSRRIQQGLPVFAISDRLTRAATHTAEQIVGGGREFIRDSDFKTLPDGTRITSVVNSVLSSEPMLYGLDYSIWVMTYVSDSLDADALYSDVIGGVRFAQKSEADYKKHGVGICCADGGPMAIVIFYSGAPTSYTDESAVPVRALWSAAAAIYDTADTSLTDASRTVKYGSKQYAPFYDYEAAVARVFTADGIEQLERAELDSARYIVKTESGVLRPAQGGENVPKAADFVSYSVVSNDGIAASYAVELNSGGEKLVVTLSLALSEGHWLIEDMQMPGVTYAAE